MRAVSWYVKAGFGGRIEGPWPSEASEQRKLAERVKDGRGVYVRYSNGQLCKFRRKEKYEMTDKLLPCPFCGGKAVHGHVDDLKSPDHGGYFVQCVKASCGASMGLVFNCGADPRPILTDTWNRRKSPPQGGEG